MKQLVELRGKAYVFDGARWYNKKTFQAPTPAEGLLLAKMLEQELAAETTDAATGKSAGKRKNAASTRARSTARASKSSVSKGESIAHL